MPIKLALLIFVITIFILPAPSLAAVSSHEKAVENLNTGLLPTDLSKQIVPKEKDFFSKVLDFLSFLGFKPAQPEIFYPRSDIQQKSDIPQEIKPSSNTPENLPKFLGNDKEVGIYQTTIPREAQKDLKTPIEYEELYEKAYFPEGVYPITKK